MTTRPAPRKRGPRRLFGTEDNALPIYSYARRSVGFDPQHEINEIKQHESNRLGIERAGRVTGKQIKDGTSAWDPDKERPGFMEGINDMRAGVCGGMAIWQLDRFTRQMFELEMVFRQCAGLGCVLISMGRTYRIDDPQDQEMLRMMTIQSQSASNRTSWKVQEKLTWQREEGIHNWAGPRPFGYPGVDPTGKKDRRGRRPEAPAERVAAERAAVQAAYSDFVLGKATLGDIARRWQGAGLIGTMGKPFTKDTVRQVLIRPINAGLISHYGQVVAVAKNVDPLIDRETYDQAMALFAGRARGRQEPRTQSAGFAHCSLCKRGLVSRPKNDIPSYRCPKDRGGCGKVGVFGQYTDAWMRELVIERLSDSSLAEAMGAALARNNDEAAELTENLSKDRALMTKLGRDLAAGMAYELMQAAAGPINMRIQEAERRLAELSAVTDVEIRAEDRAAIERDWNDGDVTARREMIRDATRGIRVEILPGRNYRFDPERMVEWARTRVAVVPLESPLS